MANHSKKLGALIALLRSVSQAGSLEQDQVEAQARALKKLVRAIHGGDRRERTSALNDFLRTLLRR